MFLDSGYTREYSELMSIESILDDEPVEIKLSEVSFQAKRYRVKHYTDVKQALIGIAKVIDDEKDDQWRVVRMLTEALTESCVLLVHGSNLTPDQVVNLVPEDFMLALGAVMDRNSDFFVIAAREMLMSDAAKKSI